MISRSIVTSGLCLFILCSSTFAGSKKAHRAHSGTIPTSSRSSSDPYLRWFKNYHLKKLIREERQGCHRVKHLLPFQEVREIIDEFGRTLSYENYDINSSDTSFREIRDFQTTPIGHGSDGTVYTAEDITDICYKEWNHKHSLRSHGNQVSPFTTPCPIASLIYMREELENHPYLQNYLVIPAIHIVGKDWILRDFYDVAIPIRDALKEDPEAKTAFTELKKSIHSEFIKDNAFFTVLIHRTGNKSNNILWVPELHKFALIDIF